MLNPNLPAFRKLKAIANCANFEVPAVPEVPMSRTLPLGSRTQIQDLKARNTHKQTTASGWGSVGPRQD